MFLNKRILPLILFFLFCAINSFASDLPQGANVVSGEASLDYSQDALNINVKSDKVITEWESFSVGVNKTVNFNRDSSFVALNRVISQEPSKIFGAINAPNGKIFLVNPNGILFSESSRVNVAGLVASTLDISNEDFLAGNYNFRYTGKNSYIINKGIISTTQPGGYICLLSGAVKNSGIAIATLGTVVLASGEKTTLSLDDDGIVSVVVDEPVKELIFDSEGNKFKDAVNNSGEIKADGGKIILTAKVLNSVFDYAINNSGILEANNLENKDGVIELFAEGAPVINSGKITSTKVEVNVKNSDFINEGEIVSKDIDIKVEEKSAINKGKIIADGKAESPNGGKINIEAFELIQAGLISANACEGGLAGRIVLISESKTSLDTGSSTEAKALGLVGIGGNILINSKRGNTYINTLATIDVSGGLISGDAGFVEISAYKQLGFYGILSGRAPPGYLGANVSLKTNLPFDPSLLNTYSLIILGEISAENIITFTNQRISINAVLNAKNTIQVHSQGADFSGIINCAQGIYNMNDGDTTISGGTYSGNQTWQDNGNITLAGNLTINNGDVKILADYDENKNGNLNLGNYSIQIDNNKGHYLQGANNFTLSKTSSDFYLNSAKLKGGNYLYVKSTAGDITVNTDISKSAGIELYANRDINVNNNLTSSSSNIKLYADYDNSRGGSLTLGNIILTVGSTGAHYLQGANNFTLDTTYLNKLSGGSFLYVKSTGGRITVYNAISKSAGIELYAISNIDVNANLSASSGNIILYADSNNNGTGDLSLGDGVDITVGATSGHYLQGSNSFILNTTYLNKLSGGSFLSIISTGNNGDITVDSAISKDAGIELYANRDINVNNNLTSPSGNIKLYADNDNKGTGILTINSSITANNKDITLRAADFAINNNINSGSGNINILNSKSGRTFGIGYTASGGAPNIQLSDTELGYLISTGTITIGSNNAGNITVDTADFGTKNISLVSGGSITKRSGSSNPAITASTLTLNAYSIGTSSTIFTTSVNTLSATANNGSIYLSNNKDLVVTSATALGVGNDIEITVNSNLTVGSISAPDTVTLTANTGSIIDGNGNANNVTATNLILSAATGIGWDSVNGSNALETQVSNLSATNTSLGDINIINTGALNLVDLNSDGYSIKNNSGAISIIATSPLTVNADVVAGGDITLTTGEEPLLNTDDLTINANIISNNGNITLQAGDDIIQNSGTIQTQTSGNTISLIAAYKDSDGIGAIIQNSSGKIGIDSTSSSLWTNLVLSAIGGITLPNTDITNLQATNTSTGDIEITNTGNNAGIYTFGTGVVNKGTGDIKIISKNPVTIDSPVKAEQAGDIYIKSVNDFQINNLISTSNEGKVTLIATGTNGYIELYNPNGKVIGGSEVVLQADTEITMDSDTSIENDGDISLTAGKDIKISKVFSSSSVGKITITTSTGAITDNNDIIGPPYVANPNIIANKLILSASTGIGSDDALETEVSNLSAINSTSGDIRIDNIGNLFVLSVVNSSGDVYLTVNLDLTLGSVSGDNVYLTANSGSIFASDFGPHIRALNANLNAPIGVVGTIANPINLSIGGNLALTAGSSLPPLVDGSVTVWNGGVYWPVSSNLIGVSGTINIIPATSLFPTILSFNPSGYVFFNAIELWPNLPPPSGMTQFMLSQLNTRTIRGTLYYEILNNFRLTSVDVATPLFYAYHPLTPLDTSSFDGINLDTGAYDFIDGILNIKEEEKKKLKYYGQLS